MSTITQSYELFVLLTSELLDSQKKEVSDSIYSLIEQYDGKVSGSSFWDLKKLAYRIKGNDQGYYFLCYFDISPEKLKLMEKEFLIDKRILRYMLVKVEKGYRFKATKCDFMIKNEDIEENKIEERPIQKKFVKREEKKELKNVEEVELKEEKVKKEVKKKKESLEEKIGSLDERLDAIVNNPDAIISLDK